MGAAQGTGTAEALAIYGHWPYNGHQLGDAINRAGVDVEALPDFVFATLTDRFNEWDAAERGAQAG